jgi:hypothetical protein
VFAFSVLIAAINKRAAAEFKTRSMRWMRRKDNKEHFGQRRRGSLFEVVLVITIIVFGLFHAHQMTFGPLLAGI